MKNYKSSMLQATFLIATIIGTSSCMNQTPEDTKAVAEQKNEQRFDNKNNKKDAIEELLRLYVEHGVINLYETEKERFIRFLNFAVHFY